MIIPSSSHRATGDCCTAERAFTLIELVIAAAISSLILVAAYGVLSAGFSTQKIIEPRSEIIQSARVAMTIISADFRCACPLSKDYDFLGMQRTMDDGTEADNVDFATHNYMPRRSREGDYCQVSYFLAKGTNGLYSLWRRRNSTIGLDPLSGGKREEIARGLLGFRLEYYDGYDWYTSWGPSDEDRKSGPKESSKTEDASNLYGMPEAVRITLTFDPDPKPKPMDQVEATPASTDQANTQQVQSPSPSDGSTNGPAGGTQTNSAALVFQTIARIELASTVAAGGLNGSVGNTNQNSNSGGGY